MYAANTRVVIYLVLAVIILYIISLPMSIGVSVLINTDENVGKIKASLFFIPVFKKKIDIKRLLKGKGIDDGERDDNDKIDKPPSKLKKFFIDCALNIIKFVCVKNASLRSKVGTGDAAADGMTVGIMRIMYTQFCAVFGFAGGEVLIEPDYDAEILLFDFFGIFSISFADIIFAVLKTAISRIGQYGRRRSYANAAE